MQLELFQLAISVLIFVITQTMSTNFARSDLYKLISNHVFIENTLRSEQQIAHVSATSFALTNVVSHSRPVNV